MANKLPSWKVGDKLTAARLNAMQNALAGGGGSDQAGGIPTTRRSDEPAKLIQFHARVTGSTQDGTNKRWTYTFAEIRKKSAGYNGWEDVTNGYTGTAYNFIEDQNAATGTWGNGVSSTNLSGTALDIVAVPTGTRVQMSIVDFMDSQNRLQREFWFASENAIDGSCS